MKTIISRNKIIIAKNNIILTNNRQSIRVSSETTKQGGSIRKSINTMSFPIGLTNSGSQPIRMSKNPGNTISYGGSLNQNLSRLNFSNNNNKNKNVRLRM